MLWSPLVGQLSHEAPRQGPCLVQCKHEPGRRPSSVVHSLSDLSTSVHLQWIELGLHETATRCWQAFSTQLTVPAGGELSRHEMDTRGPVGSIPWRY